MTYGLSWASHDPLFDSKLYDYYIMCGSKCTCNSTTYCERQKLSRRKVSRFHGFLMNHESFTYTYQLILQSKMALLAYFINKKETQARLPDPCGPIGQEVGKNLTKETNKEART